MARTTILDLPSELIASIVANLSDNDIFATRLANRHFERASLSYYGKHFFRKKGFMLNTPSLNVLRHLSEHEELRKYVQHIWFNPDCFTFVMPACGPDDQEMPPDPDDPDGKLLLLSPSDRRRYEAYRECMRDHSSLMRSSGAKVQEILTEILPKLPKLEVVGMRRSEDHAPWGWARLRDAIGEDPRVLGPIPTGPLHHLSGPTRLFIAIIHSLATTNAKLRRLYTDAIDIDNINPSLLPQSILDKACNSVWYLEINSTKAWLAKRNGRSDGGYTCNLEPENYGAGLVRLLNATRHLKEIGLQIFPDRKQSHMVAPSSRDPESWRTSYQYICMDKLTREAPLEHLERIKLEKISTSTSTLLAFLAPSAQTLRSLKIRDVRLLSSPSTSQSADDEKPWTPIFTFLHRSCPNLHYLLLYHLLHSTGGVSFTPNPPVPLPPLQTDPTTGFPNPTFGGEGDGDGDGEGEWFTKYEHLALQVGDVGGERDVQAVKRRLAALVDGHWCVGPIFTYAMDDAVWFTDTSDEEW
ncbi:hypothetical protein EJ03DRAFT_344944 [Teratosphaeria nubilosa]|uniref:F-box domain-containing protein n=1 Tax=Teratosphaeria nubilosa TaxID=161662 RepID=A0A6G1L174_9PEZI|nr:hypothetical protein EJ03DRAFT_344944 [Teratosphaeria nubilosa]